MVQNWLKYAGLFLLLGAVVILSQGGCGGGGGGGSSGSSAPAFPGYSGNLTTTGGVIYDGGIWIGVLTSPWTAP
ncbi:MAG: hypothetical protein V1701_11405 [Planctomycetota bacterium]